MDERHILECQPISEDEIGARYALTIKEASNIFDKDLVSYLDEIVVDTWAPKIQATDPALQSIDLACLGIGYCNMLIFAKVEDDPLLIENGNGFSPIFAERAMTRLNDLIIKVMSPVRGSQYELDTESRSGIILWYLYLSVIDTELPKLGRCRILVSHIILYNVCCHLTQNIGQGGAFQTCPKDV
jgi:hypothetical protein